MGQLLARISPRPVSACPDATTESGLDDNPDNDNDRLSPLPPEVVDMIIDHLPRQAIARCLRVNSLFYAVIRRRACSRLVLQPLENGAGLSFKGVIQGHAEGGAQNMRAVTAEWLPQCVRCIEVNAHGKDECDRLARTLQAASPGSAWDTVSPDIVCLNLATEEGEQILHRNRDSATCHTIASFPFLNAHTLVIRGLDTSYNGIERHFPYGFQHGTKHAVYVIDSTFIGTTRGSYGSLFLDRMGLRDIETITIVFACPKGSQWAPIPASRTWSDAEAWRWMDRLLRTLILSFVQLLGDVATRRFVRLTLVNVASIEARYLPPAAVASLPDADSANGANLQERTIPRILVDHARAMLPHDIHMSLKLKKDEELQTILDVVSIKDYLASVASSGMFDRAEMEAWM